MKLFILLISIIITFVTSANISVVEEFGNSEYKSSIESVKIAAPEYKVKQIKVVKRKVSNKKIVKNKKKTTKKATYLKETATKKPLIKNKKHRAKLVIVIDDVSHRYQLNNIKSLPFKVTPSIFPPSKMNMHSHKLSVGLKHFMVHLPLQSGSKTLNRMHKTLFITDSNIKIRSRVLEIRKLFPNAKFINNHTGSVFTRNYLKSKVLYKALKDSNFKFLDSRTTMKTVFPRLSKEFNKKYYKNDLFIDNVLNTNTILKKIKRGISLAKRRGVSVVIGHPHPQTFKALKLAAKYLKSVDVVYMDEI